jgi:hypothetical protein
VPNVLTIDDARAAIRAPSADTTMNDDLTTTYIPAVDTIVESLSGPQIPVTGRTLTVDGGGTAILLPVAGPNVVITSVSEGGTNLNLGTDYTVNSLAGIVSRGTVYRPYIFLPGYQNIVITYNAGPATPPANVKLAARIILAHLWQSDQQGARADFGSSVDDDVLMTPAGFAIPRRAIELLRPTPAMPGFA